MSVVCYVVKHTTWVKKKKKKLHSFKPLYTLPLHVNTACHYLKKKK